MKELLQAHFAPYKSYCYDFSKWAVTILVSRFKGKNLGKIRGVFEWSGFTFFPENWIFFSKPAIPNITGCLRLARALKTRPVLRTAISGKRREICRIHG